MDVTDVLRRLLRLRIAVAVVLVIAVVAAGVAYLSADGSQQSRAAVVVVPPKVADVAGGDNPLLSLDNNLAQLAVVLQGTLGSASVGRALERRGATAEFTVTTVTGDNPSFSQLTPQLIFTVTGPDAEVTRRTAAALVDQSGVALTALQDRAGVPPTSRAAVVEVSAPTTPVAVAGGGLRSAGTLGLGIVVLGLVLVLAVDAIRRRGGGTPTTGTPRELLRRFRSGPDVAAKVPPSRPVLAPAAARVATTTNAAVPIQKAPAKKAPAKKAPATKAQATKAPAAKAPATKAAGNTASAAGTAAATKPPAQSSAQSPVDKAPIDKAPIDKAPIDKAPIDKAPIDKAPIDKAAETPVERAPVNERAAAAPTDATPTRPPGDRASGSRSSASRKTAGRPAGRSSRQSRARRSRG